jgi:hypothetical protein
MRFVFLADSSKETPVYSTNKQSISKTVFNSTIFLYESALFYNPELTFTQKAREHFENGCCRLWVALFPGSSVGR